MSSLAGNLASDVFAAGDGGFAFADGGQFGLGRSVRRLGDRDGNGASGRLEFQTIASLDACLTPYAGGHQ